MIERPGKEQLEALATLEHNPSFKAIIAWLESSLQKTCANCISEHNEITLRHEQGSAQALSEILTHSAKAREHIERNKR